MNVIGRTACVKLLALFPLSCQAHVAEQGFVLLLPTGAWSTAGVAVVVVTIALLAALPQSKTAAFFGARTHRLRWKPFASTAISLCATLLLGALVWIGFYGPRDPLSNLMPLSIWTLMWIALVTLAAVFGNLFALINPWTGLARLMSTNPFWHLPNWLCGWPALAGLIGFAAFLLADPAPDDPARLARLVTLYWSVHLVGTVVFGPRWLQQAEFLTVVFRLFASLSPLSRAGFGWPGWRLLRLPYSVWLGLFSLSLLGIGSFDGLNETFLWLGWIGVNPLEFPGRSAVILPTIGGLAACLIALLAVFAAAVQCGLWLSGAKCTFRHAFAALALSVLPIAWAYHLAHYLTAWLVGSQYTLAAMSDPFATGADYLGITPFYVTTGFFNHLGSVRTIWLTQAGAVVLGHVWSVLLAHHIATKLAPQPRQAVRLTAPLSVFMIAYTFIGLWLLAAPRGA